MKKYFVHWSYGSCAKIKEFTNGDEMLECVREHVNMFDMPPTVYYGEKLEFEPAEIIKSWKVKESPSR